MENERSNEYTLSGSVPFTVISAEDVTASGKLLYKIFSEQNVSAIVSDVFVNITEVFIYHW